MESKGRKYLPIGTVVMLKGGTKRVMITSFCTITENEPNKIWDYGGCVYPEGFLASNQTCLFDHEQIEEVYHLGLADDEEEKEFKKRLKEAMKQRETQSKTTKKTTTKNSKSKPKAE